MASRHWLYFGGFAITGILLIGVCLMGLFDALSVLSNSPASGEEVILVTMLGEAAEWIVLALGLGLLAAVFFVATVVSVIRNASLPRDDRLVAVVERLEREYPLLRQFDVAGTVEPTAEDRKERLKEQYVAGEISEETFEREMAALVDDADAGVGSNRRSGGGATVEIEDES